MKKLILALDPDWAARRHARAVRDRNVIGYLDPDGTATVTGTGLPVDQAAAACARVEELVRAAKRAGHPARIGPLRTDTYLGLLDGHWQHHTREEIITDLLTTATHNTTGTEGNADPGHPTEPDAQYLPEDGAPIADGPGAALAVRRVGVEVRVGLAALLGRDEHPGEVAGWGPVPADIARTIVTAQHTAQWRYAITDLTGRLLLAGRW